MGGAARGATMRGGGVASRRPGGMGRAGAASGMNPLLALLSAGNPAMGGRAARPGAAVGGIGQKLGLGVGGTPPGMGFPSSAKLGMTVTKPKPPNPFDAAFGGIAYAGIPEEQRLARQGNRMLGGGLGQNIRQTQRRLPKVQPSFAMPRPRA